MGSLPGAVEVTETLALDLAGIQPAFASTNNDTAVTISAAEPPGMNLVGFASTPRVYLSPVAADSTASPLEAVIFDSAAQLTAIIPAGLTPGEYQLIVVNPSKEVGVLASSVRITATDPPEITGVVPNTLDNNTDQPARIVGTNFDAAGSAVNLLCLAPGAMTSVTLPATVNARTTTSIDATLPVGSLAAGTVCQVEVINADGAAFRFSAISAKQPSQNLGPWATDASLTEGRRALSAVAGRPTNTSRFVYAIGGDDGAVAGAKNTIESAPLDVFGKLSVFAPQRNTLPEARTFAGAVTAGNFVYLIGGHNGTTAIGSTLRSLILDPTAGPEITDLDAVPGDPSGLGQGQWYYRLAATFPSSDVNNPSGESLPGDPFTVLLPQHANGIALTLHWSGAAGANGYRLYRSPTADGSVDTLELLTAQTCGNQVCTCGVDVACNFTDDGQTPTTTGAPLPPGSLGKWHAASSLNVAREGHTSVVTRNPNDANQYYVYAFGGRDAAGGFLNSYEYATITVGPSNTQTLGAWAVGTANIGTAKADLAAWVVTNDDSDQVPAGEVQIFVGTGQTGANTRTGEVRSGRLDGTSTNGDLLVAAAGVLDDENAASDVAGASAGDSGGYLLLFGGTKANLVSTDTSTEVVTGPDLDNWNSLGGGSMTVRRAYAASVQESAMFFMLGGRTQMSAASTSVERAVQ
jgi:hypothetical protein